MSPTARPLAEANESLSSDLVVAQPPQRLRAALLPFELRAPLRFPGSAPRRGRVPPPSRLLTCAERSVGTASTPGTLAAATAVPAGIGEKPSEFWMIRPPAKFSSTTWATVLLIPAAKTVTKATSARPIISAAAVIAVRLGLRCAFSRARRPSRRRIRSSGQPATRARPGTSRGLKSETAITAASAPMPM